MKKTLFDISEDLEKLSGLLDLVEGDDQQEIIEQWFEQLGEERDCKLDGYAALIGEMQARAEARKAESRRLAELAASDENKARLLKERLKWFLEKHQMKTLETARYKLSVVKNSTRPLVVNSHVAIATLPDEYKKISVELDTVAVREALKQGIDLDFARLGEAGTHIRIK
ncbi:siphovirus Gp157 family protein [Chroococcidiopsidales cyanobacterium LEGE 13417]|nr:siphovirus Gp157 family protein [Chroococcidiopsidales cyanobacterium LEGE 13417]